MQTPFELSGHPPCLPPDRAAVDLLQQPDAIPPSHEGMVEAARREACVGGAAKKILPLRRHAAGSSRRTETTTADGGLGS